MNLRIARNAVLTAVLGAAAILLPAQPSNAQACSLNCQICLAMAGWTLNNCNAGCGGDTQCQNQCLAQYYAEAERCALLP